MSKVNLTWSAFKTTSPYLGWRLFSIVLIGLMLASVIASTYFIYTTVYRTLDDANTIVVLDSFATLSTINEANYAKAQVLIGQKAVVTTIPRDLRNIFISIPSSSPR